MSGGRRLAIAGAIAAVLAVAAGLWAIGSPAAQREQRLDERRLDDLQRIELAIDSHWSIEKSLPADLATLADAPGSTLPTHDPATNFPYGYEIVDARRYRLCAVFATDTADTRGRHERDHGRGRHCFDHRVTD